MYLEARSQANINWQSSFALYTNKGIPFRLNSFMLMTFKRISVKETGMIQKWVDFHACSY